MVHSVCFHGLVCIVAIYEIRDLKPISYNLTTMPPAFSSHLIILWKPCIANNMNPDQTAPLGGAV